MRLEIFFDYKNAFDSQRTKKKEEEIIVDHINYNSRKKHDFSTNKSLINIFISNINEQSKSPYVAAFPVHLMGSEVPVVQLIHPVIMMIYDVLSHPDTLQMWHRLSLFD